MHHARRIAVRLTVPSLNPNASPAGEVRAIAKHLPLDEFDLTVCSLRDNGADSTGPWLESLGHGWVVSRFRPRGHGLGHIRSWVRDVRDLNRERPCDIQHSFDFTSSPLEAIQARLNHTPFVFSQRNLAENSSRTLLAIKGLLANRVIAISSSTYNLLRSAGVPQSRIEQIPLGLDATAFRTDEDRDPDLPQQYLLLVGQLERRKRQALAVAALARLGDRLPALHLLLAGATYDPDYRASLLAAAQRLGVAERVHFLGQRSDVPRLLKYAQALLHCSASEAFGWILLEAMAAGTPIITAANQGAMDVVSHEETALMMGVSEPQEFASAVLRLANEPGLRKRLVTNGRHVVSQRFSASSMVARHARLYRDLVARFAST